MKRLIVVCLLALVIPAQSQPRAPRASSELPRFQPDPTPRPTPPPDGACDRRVYTRLVRELLSKPPEPTIFECRPSTAWAVCQAVGDVIRNAERRHAILSDLESQVKICERMGYKTPEPEVTEGS